MSNHTGRFLEITESESVFNCVLGQDERGNVWGLINLKRGHRQQGRAHKLPAT